MLIRLDPDARWPVLLAAVRDEFLGRPWDPPAEHWPGLIGGRDRVAGGTWLAVDPHVPASAALLNGLRRPEGVRPSRGSLALDVLRSGPPDDVSAYDGFHLLGPRPKGRMSGRGTVPSSRTGSSRRVCTSSSTPDRMRRTRWSIPVAPCSRPSAARRRRDGVDPGGLGLLGEPLEGDPGEAPGSLLVRRVVDGRAYGSSSVALVALSGSGVRYDFSPVPASAATWTRIVPA